MQRIISLPPTFKKRTLVAFLLSLMPPGDNLNVYQQFQFISGFAQPNILERIINYSFISEKTEAMAHNMRRGSSQLEHGLLYCTKQSPVSTESLWMSKVSDQPGGMGHVI